MSTTEVLPAIAVLLPGKQWVCHTEDKKPISPITLAGVTGELIEGNPDWATHGVACNAQKANSDWLKGVGREFIKRQRITGIDLDVQPDEFGNLPPAAAETVTRFGSYAEFSPNLGIHIFVFGEIPHAITPEPFVDYVEAYDSKRYFTVTRNHYPSSPVTIEEGQPELDAFYKEIMLNRRAKARPVKELRQKIRDLGDAIEGTRNSSLCTVGFRAGVLIEKHGLIEEAVIAEFWKQCKNWDNPEKTWATLESAIAAGRKKEREEPGEQYQEYRPGRPTASNGNGNGHHQQSVDERQGSFNLTDLGNAERFAYQYKDTVRWCQVWSSWLVFNGSCWEMDKTSKVDRLAKDTVRAIYNEAAEEPDDKRRSIIAKHAVSSESNRAVRAMLERAKSELPAVPEDFNTHLHLLNCKNGTLDLQTRELRPHNSKDMLTRCLDIKYNPLAECPLWLSFLHTILGKKEPLIEFVKQSLGMSLSGDISEQCWFLCHGDGNNGKSTLLETVGAILSAYVLSAKIESFQAKKADRANYDQAEFYGARLITASENQQGTRLNEAFIKKITGGERIRAEHKYGREFEFMPECTIWLSVNHKPVIKDMSKGMWRRVHYIPFLVTIADSQIDEKLRGKLLTEAEGVLAWLVQGCLSWYKQGRLSVPEEVRAATQSYREEQDTVSRFLSEECRFVKKARVAVKALNTRYEEWCEQNGEKYSAKDLKAELNRRGLQAKRGHGGAWLYEGVELAPTTENPPDGDEGYMGDVGDAKSEKSPRKEKDSGTLGVFTSPTSPTSPFEHENSSEGYIEHEENKENSCHFASPFEMPKATVAQMRETLLTYARSKDWPKLMVHENYAVGPGETVWNEFLRKPGFYNLEWQMAYKKVCEWNAMYPQRGKK